MLKKTMTMFFFIFLTMSRVLAQDNICDFNKMTLENNTLLFEDKTGSLSARQVSTLRDELFIKLNTKEIVQRYSKSVFWLKIKIRQQKNSCQRWLTIGSPRLEHFEVYYDSNIEHPIYYGGSVLPLNKWQLISSQPTALIDINENKDYAIFVRIFSSLSLVINPTFLSTSSFIQNQEENNFHDGIIAGLIFILVPLSIAISIVIRSPLLFSQALCLLSYWLISFILSGYLIYIPNLITSSTLVLSIIVVFSFMFTLMYIFFLLQAYRLPWYIQCNFYLLAFAYLATYVWIYYIDQVFGKEMSLIVLRGIYPLVLITLIQGLFNKIRFSWMAWIISLLLAIQYFLRYVIHIEEVPWQSSNHINGLFSAIPGALILLLTLFGTLLDSHNKHKKAEKVLASEQANNQLKLENMVATKTAELYESLHERNILLARVSHDLRSPLFAIMNTLLGQEKNTDTNQQSWILYHIKHQLSLIDELMEYSRNNLKKIEIIPTPDYLFSFLSNIEKEGVYLAQRANNKFISDFDEHLPPVIKADFIRLRQIIINLLDNAGKFTKDGTISLRVGCKSLEAEKCTISVSVSDSGPGVNDSDYNKIINAFERGENAKQIEGEGMGLAIVTQLLTHMGSSLTIEKSAQFGGGVFEFELTVNLGSEEQIDLYYIDDFYSDDIQSSEFTILLIDKPEVCREGLYDLLSGYGFDVDIADNYNDSISILMGKKIDLIICEQSENLTNGINLLRTVKKRWPTTKIFLYTQYNISRDKHYYNAVLLKPCSSSDLLNHIKDLVINE